MKHLNQLIIYVIWCVMSFTILMVKLSDFFKEQTNITFKLAYPYIIISIMLLVITIKKYNKFSDKN